VATVDTADAPTDAALPADAVIVAAETRRHLAAALAGLPARQRIVVTLRDAEGYTSDEVCDLLSISPANQRVLLHRGRATLRATLETSLTKGAVR
jgi:RNA polymerase sigma-70 factor (ECF subfamily)